MQHILNSPDFLYPPAILALLRWMGTDQNLMALHGTEHRRLRAAFNSGFGSSAVRTYQPIFETVAQRASSGLTRNSVLTRSNSSPNELENSLERLGRAR